MSAPVLSNDLLLAQNVLPKAGTPGVAQDSAPASGPTGATASSPLANYALPLMMLVFFVPIWFLSNRRQKKEQQARASLKRGDTVMTNGLIGELVEMDDRIAKVKIASGTTVRIVASTLTPYVEAEQASSKELKEAKAGSEKK